MVKEIEVIAVSGEDAVLELTVALAEADETGFHPVIVGDPDDYDRILEGIETGDSAEVILQESHLIDPLQVLGAGGASDNSTGEKLDGAGFRGIITHLDRVSGVPKPQILIRNFKVPAAWHAFAHLAWGGWNSSPSPMVHCAMHRDWGQRFGAKVVSITGSQVQCTVAQPPTSDESALDLARLQFAYCGKVAESTAELARKLKHARFWYFCWD